MVDIPSPFAHGDGDTFDEVGSFVPEHLPDPGPFLDDHEVLVDEDHVGVHATAREAFERRTVYDVTFGYNLARLNLDTRHPDAGYRYAVERRDGGILRAEFTPTTPFCPQSHTLTVGSFRAWNGLREIHEFDLVRVRVHPMHQNSGQINDQLSDLEDQFEETGEMPDVDTKGADGAGAGRGPRAPF